MFFPSGQKILIGQVKKYPGWRLVGLLLTEGQKYARVGSGPISLLMINLLSYLVYFLYFLRK